MKKTIIISSILASTAMTSQANELWATRLSTYGSNASDAVLEMVSGDTDAPDGFYLGGWLNDFGSTYDLKFASYPDSSDYIFGSAIGSWGDIGFSFEFSNITEQVNLHSLTIDTFTWTSEDDSYEMFDILYLFVKVNDGIVYDQGFTTIIIPAKSGMPIYMQLDHVTVCPGDTISITICVSATESSNAGFGMSYITAEGCKD